MDDIQIFKNEVFGEVRVVGTNEEPLFCAKDVATALGYSEWVELIWYHRKITGIGRDGIINLYQKGG